MTTDRDTPSPSLLSRLSSFVGGRNGSARDALEEYVETGDENGETDSASVQERALLSNILKLRDVKVVDVMVPRADIIAVDDNVVQNDLLALFAEQHCSRVPVYKDTLDNVIGTIHVKDILGALADGKKECAIADLIKDIPAVSPAMDVLDLILFMRQKHRHMALVVDEHGGVDGLITISDVIEEIVGDLDDEHDRDESPEMREQEDGSLVLDARVELKDFEETYGAIFTTDEHEECDTIGGLVCHIDGRVPAKGELLTHSSGALFEILDADPRRVSLIKIHALSRST